MSSTPPELCQDELVSILQWLPVKKLIQLERVCREWKKIVIPMAFRKANRKSFMMCDYARYPTPWRSRDGSIDRCYIFNALLDRLGLYLTSFALPCLRVKGVSVTELLQLLTAKCPNLKHLDISYNRLRSEWLSMLPTTLDSIRIDTTIPQRDLLLEFIRTRPGLKQLWMSADCDNPIREVPKWLAQYCPELTSLSLFMYGGSYSFTQIFYGVFSSLTRLKVFEVSMPNCFNYEDLEELCANCPDLEVLMLDKEESVRMTDVTPILQLQKLVRLDLRKFDLTDQSVAALCEGVGVTLEYFQLRPNSLTDATLYAIGYHCHNLTDLRFFCGCENPFGSQKFTPQEMANLIETITRRPHWTKYPNNRQLSVAAPLSVFGKVNLAQYGGRVVLKRFAFGFAFGFGSFSFDSLGFRHTDNFTLANNRLTELVDIKERDLLCLSGSQVR